MSLLIGKDLTKLDGIQAVAKLGAGHELQSEPGSAFNYSDQGTDTLTALIEAVSGMPVADFVRQRVLAPLGMHDSTCVMTKNHALRSRACSKYAGSRGAWTGFWSPDKPPLFPFFLGSQGLYSALEDYARFVQFWQNEGRVDKNQLLGSQFVRMALTPSPQRFRGDTRLPGLVPDYGYLMQLWTGEVASERNGKSGRRGLVAFGHSGSDGTWAWVFPEQNAMVLYFTQSRGNMTGLRVEAALGELFLGVPFDLNQTSAPPLEQYLGYYSENERSRYQAIIRDGQELALETPGKRIRQLVYAGSDRWKFRVKPAVELTFDRSERGQATGFHIGDHKEFRLKPSTNLPTVDKLVASVAKAHRIDLVESLGPIRIDGALTMEKLGLKGGVNWPNRFREDSVVGGRFKRIAFDEDRISSPVDWPCGHHDQGSQAGR